ncbi:MAG: hypothetical protein K0Q64_125 [Nitrobacter vulgaris]|nr:hypothetical protein [Nitrobacter vulgaris]
MPFGDGRYGQATRRAEFREVGEVCLRALAGRVEREMQNSGGDGQRREGPRMELAENRGAERMRSKPGGLCVPNRDFRDDYRSTAIQSKRHARLNHAAAAR